MTRGLSFLTPIKIVTIAVCSIAVAGVGGIIIYNYTTPNEQSSKINTESKESESNLMGSSETASQNHINIDGEEPSTKDSTVNNVYSTQRTDVKAQQKRQSQNQTTQLAINDRSNQNTSQTTQNNKVQSNTNSGRNTAQASSASTNGSVTTSAPISNTFVHRDTQTPCDQRYTPVSNTPATSQSSSLVQEDTISPSNTVARTQSNQVNASTNAQTQQQSRMQSAQSSTKNTPAFAAQQPLPQPIHNTRLGKATRATNRQFFPQQSQSYRYDTSRAQETTARQVLSFASVNQSVEQQSSNTNGSNVTVKNSQNDTEFTQTTQSYTPQIITYPPKETNIDVMIRTLTHAYKEYEKNIPETERDCKTPYGSLDIKRTKLLLLMEKSFDSENRVPNKKGILAVGLGTDSGIKLLNDLVFDNTGAHKAITLTTVTITYCIINSYKHDTIEELVKEECDKRNIETLTIGVSTRKGPKLDSKYSPKLLVCNEYSNLCYMFSFLQILSNLEAFESGIAELAKTSTLGKALMQIILPLKIEKHNKGTSNNVIIEEKHMDMLFEEFNEACKEFLGEKWLKKDEQNSADNLWQVLLRTPTNGQTMLQKYCSINGDIYKNSTKTAFPDCQTISLSQFYLRLGQKYHLFEALEYFFHDYNTFDKSQEIEFRSLPAVLIINFEKQIFSNISGEENGYKSLSAIFVPRFYLETTGQMLLTHYLFKGAIIYKPVSNNNISDTSSGHYYAIVLYGDQYYKCDTTIITTMTPELAEKEISLYGLTWYYEKM